MPDALTPAKPIVGYVRSPALSPALKLTAARLRVLEVAGEGPPRIAAETAH